ncbi:MAG: hypothetical protein WKF59_15210 [Chitinophagaceae bacterium]
MNYHVTKLVRIRIMNITLSGIAPGKWRYLTQMEIEAINNLVASSIKHTEASLINKKK